MLWKRSTMATSIFRWRDDGLTVADANPRMLSVVGLSLDAALRMTAAELLPSIVARSEHMARFESIARGGADEPGLDVEVVERRAGAVTLAYQVIAYGGDPGTVAVQLNDITVRRQEEQKLRRQRDVQQGILDLLPQAIYWRGADGIYLGGNRALCELVGAPEIGAIIGKRGDEIGGTVIGPIGDCSVLVETNGDRSQLDEEVELVGADGDARTMLSSVVSLKRNDSAGSDGVVGVLHDISTRKKMERELLTHKETLEETVQARTAELEKKLELIAAQSQSIRALSTPVLQVWDGILMLPIIGVIDARRIQELMSGLLEAISRTKSGSVIIDITGVENVDKEVARYLMQVFKAATLLGARCVISGIRASLAITLTEMEEDLSGLATLRDLKSALHDCIGNVSR